MHLVQNKCKFSTKLSSKLFSEHKKMTAASGVVLMTKVALTRDKKQVIWLLSYIFFCIKVVIIHS